MVTVTDVQPRTNAQGEQFFALILMSGLEMVQSQQTGKYYATARKTSIPCTFPEEYAKTLIGTKMPGVIEKVETAPYDYTIQQTGEIISLGHSWVYNAEPTVEEHIMGNSLQYA